MGKETFIYTKYPDAKGCHFFFAKADVPHIKLINNPNIIKALMGPNEKKILPLVSEKIDGKVQLDPLELRTQTIGESIFGRTGFAFNQFYSVEAGLFTHRTTKISMINHHLSLSSLIPQFTDTRDDDLPCVTLSQVTLSNSVH